jgi:hypothetical protein
MSAGRVIPSPATASTTESYADQDSEFALEVMAEMG